MGFSKKTGKGRLDKYYFLAKDQGYRARSAFKLVQLHKKYNLLDQARVVIDLCAAPGGWLQVAAKYTPVSHVVVGVDLVPIKPIPGVKTIVADITTEKCRAELKKELKNWKADVVLHDGAPNVGKSWLHDAYSQSELVLHSLKLATEFLASDGCFVTKVFRSKDYNALMWVFNQLFKKVEATKPASSRSVSAEIFVVCRGFKAPSHIDPRFLDPKHVFEDITSLQQASGAKMDLLHPEKKIRHREGYEDGATMLFKAIPIEEFVASNEPNMILASVNRLLFTKDTPKEICDSADLNAEVRDLCMDLKVLGRREFKILSKWRKEIRLAMGFVTDATAKEGQVEETVVVEENPIVELDGLAKKKNKQDKREKKKALERKAKQRMRMQLSMGNADDLADEFAENEPLFSLVKSSKIVGNEDIVLSDSEADEEASHGIKESDIDTLSEGSDEALWESDLENDYDRRQEKLLSKNALELARSKRKRGLDIQEASDAEISDVIDSDGSEEDGAKLTTSLLSKAEEKAEKDAKTALWYSNPLFRELEENPMESLLPESSKKKEKQEKKRKVQEIEQEKTEKGGNAKSKKPEPGEIIFVKADVSEDEDEEAAIDPKTMESVMSPHGMTLAARLAKDQKRARKDLVDESFNRYSFKDDYMLPRWFTDDESKHNRPQKPITKEGIALLKAKMKELDARPIKKELEAKGRNRQRVARKLDAMKKKAAVIADAEDMGERQKSEQIQRMLSKASKPQRKETKLVIARGGNRGVKGRPKGVKGHYKMVDSRMKKEVRAQKRIKARGKKNGGRRK